tara:strand:+ start:21890 stop:23083 length:1194 start_codon:yes stop_codon:yes gene_type:complete
MLQFRWVYDCGTSSKPKFLNDQIDNLARHDTGVRDLLFISHFDKDHVSGVTRLIKRVGVRAVVLPYMPLWRRLLIAFDEGLSADDELLGFYRNPAAYLSDLEQGPARIIFVGQEVGEGGEPGPVGEPPAGPVLEVSEGLEGVRDPDPVKADVDPSFESTVGDMRKDLEAMKRSARAEVELLRCGGGLYALGLWEFIPYNDPCAAPRQEKFEKFIEEVTKASDVLIAGESTKTGMDPVKALERIYDSNIGYKNRNKGSLFVYAGPLGAPEVAYRQDLIGSLNRHLAWPLVYLAPGRCGLLLTGDGDLSDDHAFDLLRRHMGPCRMGRIDVLQVMHHGSKKSSRPGRAAQMRPSMSVFCANPDDGRYNHPDAEVVRDFLRYGPTLVDQHQSLWLNYTMD